MTVKRPLTIKEETRWLYIQFNYLSYSFNYTKSNDFQYFFRFKNINKITENRHQCAKNSYGITVYFIHDPDQFVPRITRVQSYMRSFFIHFNHSFDWLPGRALWSFTYIFGFLFKYFIMNNRNSLSIFLCNITNI